LQIEVIHCPNPQEVPFRETRGNSVHNASADRTEECCWFQISI
jgi:hypothetical protein